MMIPQMQSIYTFGFNAVEKLSGGLKELQKHIVSFNQGSLGGGHATLIVATLVSFEIALVICRIANSILYRDPDDPTPQSQRRLTAFSALFVCTAGTSVYVSCKKLSIPLGFWRVVSVSFATSVLYLCYRKK